MIRLYGESLSESSWISINDKSFNGSSFGVYVGMDRNFYLFDLASPIKLKVIKDRAFFLFE